MGNQPVARHGRSERWHRVLHSSVVRAVATMLPLPHRHPDRASPHCHFCHGCRICRPADPALPPGEGDRGGQAGDGRGESRVACTHGLLLGLLHLFGCVCCGHGSDTLCPLPLLQYYREPEPSPGWFPTHLIEPLIRSFR